MVGTFSCLRENLFVVWLVLISIIVDICIIHCIGKAFKSSYDLTNVDLNVSSYKCPQHNIDQILKVAKNLFRYNVSSI
jgi:hypothetical protein